MFQGGIKVLVAGSWSTEGSCSKAVYAVLFDGVPVPTEAVQPGLLRCHAPGNQFDSFDIGSRLQLNVVSAHETGDCRLEVARDGAVITEPVIFKYKVNPDKPAAAEEAGCQGGGEEKALEGCDDASTAAAGEDDDKRELKNTLLQKLELLCDKMAATATSGQDAGLGGVQVKLDPVEQERRLNLCDKVHFTYRMSGYE